MGYRGFITEESQMPKQHLKECLMSFVIREMQINTTLRLHHIPVRIAYINNSMITHVGKDVQQWEHSSMADRTVNFCNNIVNQFGGLSEYCE